jgi:hypothetical protein
LSAQQKNLIDNPLKAAWYEVLGGMGIPDATNMIEATFARAAAEQFEVALNKTAEYLELSDEAFVDVEAQVGEFNTMPPQTEDEHYTEERQARSAALRARASRGSLPFSSATDSTVDDADRIFNAAPKPKLAGISKYGKPL